MFSAKRPEIERPYSLIASTSMDHISDDEDSILRVQSTPVDMNAYKKNMFFDKYDDNNTSSSGPYCLVGEDVPSLKSNNKKSIKQRRTTKRNSNLENIQDEAGGTYCEIADTSSKQNSRRDESYTEMASEESVYQVPPSNKQIPSESLYQVPPSEDLYQVPPSSNFPKRFSGSGFPNTSSHNQNVDTIEEDYYGVPSSYPKHPDSKAINVPIKPKRTNYPMSVKSDSIDTYDNVNLQTQTSAECYNNVQLKNSPVAGENYDNVNIRNKESPSNESYYQQPPQSLKPSRSSEEIFYQGSPSDSYYQRPPSSSVSSNPGDDQYYQSPPTTFRAKPEGDIKQNSYQPQQYTFVKTKSMKQKRTATIVKQEIDISDSPSSPSTADEITKKSDDENQQIDNNTSKQEEQNKKIQEAKEILLAQAEVQPGSPKPIPKPRIKQSRTSEKRVETGYRMSQIATKQPLDETYEWSKVFV